MAMAAVVVVGAVISAYGQYKSNEAQAEAERANSSYYNKQADNAKLQSDRAISVFRQDADLTIGGQVSSLAKAGVDMSGSALSDINESKQKEAQQISTLDLEGQNNQYLAKLRAQQSATNASNIQGGEGLQMAGTLLGGFGSAAKNSTASGTAQQGQG